MYKKKIFLFIILGCILIFSSFTMIKTKYSSENKKPNIVTEPKDSSKSFSGLDLPLENLKISFENSPISLKFPIYIDKNRHYLPLTEIIEVLGGKTEIKDSIIEISLNDKKISIDKNNKLATINSTNMNLKKKLIVKDNIAYISLFDLTKLLNLKTTWKHQDNEVSFYWNKDNINKKNINSNNTKKALIRIEDITSGYRYNSPEALEKLRVVSDYLYKENIPFSVAWVPRYVNPQQSIDNSPSEKNSIYNSDFIFTLDYFIDRGGIIGLHGYTHQHGNEESVVGTEFSRRHNHNDKAIRERLTLAIDTAKKLDIPIGFFESPHYDATAFQHEIMGSYFDIIYEHAFSMREKNISYVTYGNKKVKFIPTPLNYLDGASDLNNMINKINRLDNSSLASLFYHPSIEFEFIQINRESSGYPVYTYSESSPLHTIVNHLHNKGYNFSSITDVN